ncbi:MAG TPA: hypothetical protein PLD23_04695 [Armatimonadota bacterium]|nr:hypothetical protein [Armatimonadota bacterium]HQK92776.1 hypothetical protein [Armatimonadota bacterium]
MVLGNVRTKLAVALGVSLAALAGLVWIAVAQEEVPAGEQAAATLAEARQVMAAETTDPLADADDTERFVVNFRFIGGWWREDGPEPSFEDILGHPRGQIPPPISRQEFFDDQAMARIGNQSGKLDTRVSPVYSLVCSAQMPGRAELKAPDRYFYWEATARRELGDTVTLDLCWNPRKGPKATDEYFSQRYFHRTEDGQLKTGLRMKAECTIGRGHGCLCLGPGPDETDLLLCYLLVEEAWP